MNSNKTNILIGIFVLVLLVGTAQASAMEPVVIHVASADPATRTYSFLCEDNGSGLAGNGIRNWFVYPEDTDTDELVVSLPANQPLNHTFARDAYYDITCHVPNPPGLNYTSLYRLSTHIDLRTQLGNPAVIPLSVAPGSVTEMCVYNSNGMNYTISWLVSTYGETGGSGNTYRYFLNETNNTITFTAPLMPSLYDTHCLIHLANGNTIDLPWAIDFPNSTSGEPYIADHYGIDLNGHFAPFNYSMWMSLHNATAPVITNTTTNTTTNSTNSTNSTNTTGATGSIALTTQPRGVQVTVNALPVGTTDGTGVLFLSNVPVGTNTLSLTKAGYVTYVNTTVSVLLNQTTTLMVTLPVVSSTNTTTGNTTSTTFTNLQTIPATCTGGSITSDVYTGGRAITCTNGSTSLSVTAWDKPDNTNPQYFEMYKKSQTGSGVHICLLSTCISNNGYAKSPNYPLTDSSGASSQPTTGALSLTTTPGGATVTLNGNVVGTTSAGASGFLLLQNVSTGSVTLALSLSGYQTSTLVVSVTAGQTTQVQATLQQQVPTNGTTYLSMQDIPATCTGGTISNDSIGTGGSRVLTCTNTGNTLTVTAWNKPGNYQPRYFELYKTSQTGSGLALCLGATCISNNGYAKSQDFPILA